MGSEMCIRDSVQVASPHCSNTHARTNRHTRLPFLRSIAQTMSMPQNPRRCAKKKSMRPNHPQPRMSQPPCSVHSIQPSLASFDCLLLRFAPQLQQTIHLVPQRARLRLIVRDPRRSKGSRSKGSSAFRTCCCHVSHGVLVLRTKARAKTHFCFFSAGFRIWKEQSKLSSTLIIAPALSNSPQ